MKFAHIADVHLGYEQYNQPFRLNDFSRVFREAIEKAITEKVDFILIAGDLFHSSRPSPRTIRDAIEILSLAKEKEIPIFAIEGNHDKTIKETSIYDLLEHLGLVYTVGLKRTPRENEFQKSRKVGKNYLVYGYFEGVEIHGLRHYTKWQILGKENLLKLLFREPKEDSILMLHQAVEELSKDTKYEKAVEVGKHDLPEGFAYYALGHIHQRREGKYNDAPLVYSGSLERTEVREASHAIIYDRELKVFEKLENVKGFYVVKDFENLEFVKVNARPFYRVVIKAKSKEDIKKRLREAMNAVERDSMSLIYLEGTIRGGVDLKTIYSILSDYSERIAYYNVENNILSEEFKISEDITREEFFNEFERELFYRLRVSPKEFEDEIDTVVEFILEKYSSSKEKVQKEEPKVEKEKPEEKQRIEVKKPKAIGRIDAWVIKK